MQCMTYLLLLTARLSLLRRCDASNSTLIASEKLHRVKPGWLIHAPLEFKNGSSGSLVDVRSSREEMKKFSNQFYDSMGYMGWSSDGEIRDVVEHFFWGMNSGIAMEIGARDGTTKQESMTRGLEDLFGWKRILVEGDPILRDDLRRLSPHAFTVSASICQQEGVYHYGIKGMVSGVIELMDMKFLEIFYKELLDTTSPRGNWSSANWDIYGRKHQMPTISCVPLRTILYAARARHINFFILDVEGAEYDVLLSLDWDYTVFDVLCVETEAKVRPEGYTQMVTSFLAARGYEAVVLDLGRNSWYKHSNYTASSKPGLNVTKCWNGAMRSSHRKSC